MITTKKSGPAKPTIKAGELKPAAEKSDRLKVLSVEKAFRILNCFDAEHTSLGLTQIASLVGIDKSAAQRFTHTLESLGYLRKDPQTRRLELTVKSLTTASNFLKSNRLVQSAFPYLSQLNQVTDETVNLTMLDETDVVFLSRFVSRHVFKSDVVVGSRLPAYCTATGIAILSRKDPQEAAEILAASNLRAYTPHTVWQIGALQEKIARARQLGYATAFEEYYHDDLSFSAAVLDASGAPAGAIAIAVSRARYTPEEAEEKFAKQVVAAANAIKI